MAVSSERRIRAVICPESAVRIRGEYQTWPLYNKSPYMVFEVKTLFKHRSCTLTAPGFGEPDVCGCDFGPILVSRKDFRKLKSWE